MASVNDYNKRLMQAYPDAGTGNNTTTEDYYKLARDQEYTALLNKEVQLENAKSNAMKYTQNQINAQGFGGTGYGSSLQSGIYNTYMNRAGEAQNQYAGNVNNVNLQEAQYNQEKAEAQANDRFQSIATMLSQADSVNTMNGLLTDYGYGSVDANGEFQWGKKPEGMSEDDWYQMRYYYGLQKNAIEQAYGSNNSQWADRVMQVSGIEQEDGTDYQTMVKSMTRAQNIADVGGADEVKNFFMTANNGDILQINSNFAGTSQTNYAMYYNGKLYEIDADVLGGRKPSVTVTLSKKK